MAVETGSAQPRAQLRSTAQAGCLGVPDPGQCPARPEPCRARVTERQPPLRPSTQTFSRLVKLRKFRSSIFDTNEFVGSALPWSKRFGKKSRKIGWRGLPIGRVGGRGWALMRREAALHSVMIHSRTILRVFRCVPADVRVWVLETCVLCAV